MRFGIQAQNIYINHFLISNVDIGINPNYKSNSAFNVIMSSHCLCCELTLNLACTSHQMMRCAHHTICDYCYKLFILNLVWITHLSAYSAAAFLAWLTVPECTCVRAMPGEHNC